MSLEHEPKEQIEELYEQVEGVLRDYPDTRNSDKLLTWKVWQRHYGVGECVGMAEFVNGLPSAYNVQRIRQKLNEKKQYPPTNWEVARHRRWNEAEWRRALGYVTQEEYNQGLVSQAVNQ